MIGIFNPRQTPGRKAGSQYTFGLLQDQISTWGLCAAGGRNDICPSGSKADGRCGYPLKSDPILLDLRENLLKFAFLMIRAGLR